MLRWHRTPERAKSTVVHASDSVRQGVRASSSKRVDLLLSVKTMVAAMSARLPRRVSLSSKHQGRRRRTVSQPSPKRRRSCRGAFPGPRVVTVARHCLDNLRPITRALNYVIEQQGAQRPARLPPPRLRLPASNGGHRDGGDTPGHPHRPGPSRPGHRRGGWRARHHSAVSPGRPEKPTSAPGRVGLSPVAL